MHLRDLLLGSTLVAILSTAVHAQTALLLRDGGLVPVRVTGGLHAALEKAVLGPDAQERARGLASAVPAGTQLLAVDVAARRCAITLDARFLRAIADGTLEDAIEQLTKTAFECDRSLLAVDLFVPDAQGRRQELSTLLGAGAALGRAMPEPSGGQHAQAVQGALTGRTIVLSAGHGYYWHSSLGWTTQRPSIDGLIEDLHTNEIVIRWIAPFLENLGARVITCRERSESVTDAVVDDANPAPAFTTTGLWTPSASSGYAGGGYRHTGTAPGANARATWHVPVAQSGTQPVYVWYRAGTNRSSAAR